MTPEDIQQWLNEKLSKIANQLPHLILGDPASFQCGHEMGYKQCLLDLDRLLENDE